MNMQTISTNESSSGLTRAQVLLKGSLSGLSEYWENLQPLQNALRTAEELSPQDGKKIATRLQAKLTTLEPSITMIGQIKSGKTTLVNCMVGRPKLLPADVNPWTSVVTSLHLSPTPLTSETCAKFSFFEQDEWKRLTAGGGRIGELADRAGADEELTKIKAQVEAMREKSQARLGRKFEALLGDHHEYGYFDEELIERYVCLGDTFDQNASPGQGRFADITRSADLYFHQPAVPMPLCIRDTPGVNDTFMMREQITIRSIRDSRLCVVVLSAHQALSSTDLALVRLITNVSSRDVIIFVNRIDELSDPAVQVPQIRESIEKTMTIHGGPLDAKVIFGSALWAESAMLGTLPKLPEASKTALLNWAEVSADADLKSQDAQTILWHLSGLPELNLTIADRIAEGVGHEAVQHLTAGVRNLISGIQMQDNFAAKAEVGDTVVHSAPDEVAAHLDSLRARCLDELGRDLEAIQAEFSARLERAHRSFLGRATEALVQHLEKYGEKAVWEYDPSGLRMLLSASYKSYGRNAQAAYERCIDAFSKQLVVTYHSALRLPEDLFDITAPPPPRVPPPVSLGQTIALDLKGNWWKSWWFRRRGYEAFAAEFHEMVKAETIAFVDDLKNSQADVLRRLIVEQSEIFVGEQSDTLLSVLRTSTAQGSTLDELFDLKTLETRDKALKNALGQLKCYAS